MKIIDKVLLFRKLAEEKNDIWTKEDYDTFVSEIDNHYQSQIITIISEYQNKPYFKLEDFLNALNTENVSMLLYNLKNNYPKIKEEIIKKIMTYCAEHMVKGGMSAAVYIHLEDIKDYIPQDILIKAQRKVIFNLMFAINRARLWDRRGDYMRVSGAMDAARKGWQILYNQSKTFPKAWLEELAKVFGVDFYVDAFGDSFNKPENQINKIKNQDKLTIHDIALLYKYEGSFRRQEFIDMIDKSDDEAKQYMRSWLYTDYGGKRRFMLDDEMKPMNDMYKTVEWGGLIVPIHLYSLYSEDQKKWHDIFDAYKLVPQ